MTDPLNQTKSKAILYLIIVIGILLIGTSFYLGMNYGKGDQKTNQNTNQSPVLLNTNTSVSNLNLNANSNINESTVSKICEIGKEYKKEAGSPITCECPSGYEFETVRTEFGSCPREGMRDCLASVVKCVEKIKVGPGS